MKGIETSDGQVSRRGFLTGALVGAGALAFGDRWALAEALITGKRAKTAADIRGNGVAPGEVRLNNNENPLGASLRVTEAVSQHLFEMNRYDLSPKLPEILARRHGILSGGRADAGGASILIAPGSDTLLHAAGVLAAGGGAGEVIEATPAYGRVAGVVEGFREDGANAIRVPLTRTHVHDLDAMRRAITPETTCVVITNPNNPTGTIVSHAAFTDFVDAVPPHVMVVIDEAYIHFVSEPDYRDAIDLALTRKNVIVTRTFSKVYGLAGMRIGYAVANRAILRKMKRFVKFDETISVLSQAAAVAALGDAEFVRRSQQTVADGRAYLGGALTRMGLSYTPSHANFMMIDVGMEAAKVRKALRRRKIFVSSRPREAGMSAFMRVSIGTPEEMEVFIAALEEILP